MSTAGSAAPFDPREIFATLIRHEVGFVTVGAFALVAHGVVRATGDVDVVPDPADGNRRRLADALAELEAIPDGEPGAPVDTALLARDANMRFQTCHGQLDLLCSRQYAELYPRLAAGSVVAEAAGLALPVVGREDLIALKAAAGRDKDVVDIGDLLALDAPSPTDPDL